MKRDFAQRDFDKSLNKEVEAFQRYYAALGNVDADNYDLQAEYAVREVQNILNPDPKEYRAFEYEKYGKLAGLSQSVINEGLNAIENDDWDTQKKVTKKILRALENNPQAVLPDGYYFTKATDGDINVMIAEDKAIQEAVYTSIELKNIKTKVSKSIKEKTKDIQPLTRLNPKTIENFSYSLSFRKGSLEDEFYQKERDKILSGELGEEMKSLTDDLSEKQNQFNQILAENKQKRETISKVTARIQKEISSNNSKLSELQSELTSHSNNFYESYDAAVLEVREKIYGPGGSTIGGPTEEFEKLDFAAKSELFSKWDGLKRGEHAIRFASVSGITKDTSGLSPELIKLGKKMNQTQSKIQDIKNLNFERSKVITKTINENKTDWVQYNEASKALGKAQMTKISFDNNIKQQAAKNLLSEVKKAQAEYNQIVAEESKDLTEYKNKISNILKEIPTFENKADSLVDLDPVRLRAKLVDLAGEGNINESRAVEIALKELGEIGDAPVSEYMTGPYWESSNIKTAAMVRSKKYGFVDDYDYMSAYDQGPLPLDAASRAELEGELKGVLGSSNPILDALNQKVESISGELNLTKEQSQNLTAEISKLENELSSLKNSENAIQAQINDLSNQFNSKESLIAEKTQNLASLQDQLNPISERMNALQGQRAELDTKLNDQLSTIANQVKNQGQASDEANKLKTQFENQIAQLDNQLKQYETQSVEINGQLTTLTTELSVLETENPEIANQIKSLNKDLENFVELKADLAMATAKKLGLNVNENTLKSVKVVEGKVVVSLEGTNLVSIVDREMLIEDASKFIDPTSELSINTKVYAAGALNRELVTREFVQAAKNISASAKIDVIAQASAVQSAGATSAESAEFARARATTISARKDWDAAMQSGDKQAQEAAEKAFMAAREAETMAGKAVVDAVGTASAAAVAAQSAKTTVAAAQEAASSVQEVATQVAEVTNDATAAAQAAQEATLDALWAAEEAANNTFDVFRATAAIRQVQAQMNGNEFSYKGASSFEEAMKAIDEMEEKFNAGDKSAIVHGQDPHKIGKCGKASC